MSIKIGSFGKIVIALTSLQIIGLPPALADETLRGGVEELGAREAEPTLTPAVPMPAPVFKPKPLKGSAQDEGGALQGAAQDDDGRLSGQRPVYDSNRNVLQGSAVSNDASLSASASAADPDANDEQLNVEWDKWHNRLLWSIQSGVQEIINSPENIEPRFDPRRGRVVVGPNIPLGTRATFFVRVSADRRVTKATIVESSGYADYDKALLDAIYSLDGSAILKFPRNSRRQRVNETATIITSDHGEREFFKFNDVEKYRVPGR